MIVLLISLVLVQEIKAQFLCDVFNTCPSSTAPEPSASHKPSSAIPSTPSSSAAPSHSSAPPPPSPSSTAPKPSSSVASSAKPTHSSTPSEKPTSDASSTPSATDHSSSTTLPSATPSSSEPADGSKGGNNIGVIVGSVCGFVAIIGAGFAYAFFSKTRRNNRNKRLYSENGDMYNNHNSYQSDPFKNARPSPALAASAVHAADDIHQHNNNANQWGMMDHQQPYANYNNNSATMMSPQPPMAVVAKQHDPYYTNSPQMTYPVDPNANYYNNQPYYDPNMGYQQQQQHYVAEPQYDPYAIQQQQQLQSPVMSNNNTAVSGYGPSNTAAVAPVVATTNSTVYLPPNSYPEGINKDQPAVPTTNGSYR